MDIIYLILTLCLLIIFTGISVLLLLGLFGFTIKPVITFDEDTITAQPSRLFLLLTSYIYYKHVIISKHTKTINVSTRICWLLHLDKNIQFNEVKEIYYKYSSYFEDNHGDKSEEFVVGLILNTNAYIKLFSFVGNETCGSQEDSSRTVVELISQYMNKKLTR